MKQRNRRRREALRYIERMNKAGRTWDSPFVWSKAACHRIARFPGPYSKRF